MNFPRTFIAGGIVSLSGLLASGAAQGALTSRVDNSKILVNGNPGYITDNFSSDSDRVILARMLFGEARNCSYDEKIVIAFTAINRSHDGKKWNGESIKGSILKPLQYSCFNEGDPNKKKLMDPQKYDNNSWDECLSAADTVLDGRFSFYNKGQTNYHTPTVHPTWADSKLMESRTFTEWNPGKDFKHVFYKEK